MCVVEEMRLAEQKCLTQYWANCFTLAAGRPSWNVMMLHATANLTYYLLKLHTTDTAVTH